jgi:hypothetical protein
MTYIRYVLNQGSRKDQEEVKSEKNPNLSNEQVAAINTQAFEPNDFLNVGNSSLDQFGVRDQLGRPAPGTVGANILA